MKFGISQARRSAERWTRAMVMGTHCEAVGGEVFSCVVNAVTRLAAQCPRNLSSVPGMSTFVSYPVLRLTQPAIQWVTWAVLPAPKQC